MLVCTALLLAGLLGLTLNVPLQGPSLILLGLSALFSAFQISRFFSRSSASEGLKGLRPKKSVDIGCPEFGWLLLVSVAAIFYFVGRALLSPVWDLGVEDLTLIFCAGILYLVAGYVVRGKRGIHLRLGLAWVVIVLLLMHVGSCFLQLWGGEGYSLSLYFAGVKQTNASHITGMYSYYGSFANFAVMAGLLCLSLAIWGRFSFKSRGLLLSLSIISLSFSLWSLSRSAALSLVVGLIVYFVLLGVSLAKQNFFHKLSSLNFVWLGFMMLVIVVLGASYVFKQRGGIGIEAISESDARAQFWSMAAEQWTYHPIVGAGSRSYSYECFRYWNPNLPTSQANPEFVHNEYLQLMTDYGIVGLLLVLVLFFGHLWFGIKRVNLLAEKIALKGLRKGSHSMALLIAGVSGMAATCVHIIFDFRMHLLANLLLFVCCVVWILPLSNPRGRGAETGMKFWFVFVSLLFLGGGALAFGSYQFYGGLPMMQNKIAKEDGTWQPEAVDRKLWISTLEKSVERVPTYVRYQRLGTLYRLEANCETSRQQELLQKAESSYLASIERHRDNIIPKINLAAIYVSQEKWEQADEMYASASDLAKARESWLVMHSRWAECHLAWAQSFADDDMLDEALQHMEIATNLYRKSRDYGSRGKEKTWLIDYTKALIYHSFLLDKKGAFDESGMLFKEAMNLTNWWPHQTETKLRQHYGRHLYMVGKSQWLKRDTTSALASFRLAKKHYLGFKHFNGDQVDEEWTLGYEKVVEVLDFFEKTGVK